MIMAQMDPIAGAEESREKQGVMLRCWQCRASLAEMTPETRTGSGIRVCPSCTTVTQYRDGIWRALSPQRVDHFRNFIAEYEFIRGEGTPDRVLQVRSDV